MRFVTQAEYERLRASALRASGALEAAKATVIEANLALQDAMADLAKAKQNQTVAFTWFLGVEIQNGMGG